LDEDGSEEARRDTSRARARRREGAAPAAARGRDACALIARGRASAVWRVWRIALMYDFFRHPVPVVLAVVAHLHCRLVLRAPTILTSES
jgi:hypothetical protein